MKKLLLLLLLSIGLIGITSADNIDDKAALAISLIENIQRESLTAIEVETNTLKLKAIKSCKGCNLQGADLNRANLSWTKLNGAKLSGANLNRANLSGADLSGANLFGANLSGADLGEADLSEAEFDGATFCNTETPWGIDNSGC